MRISNDVLTVISSLQVTSGPPDRVRILDKLDRAMYAKTNKVLEAIGGKWDRKAQAHVFKHDISARNKIDRLIITGEVSTDADLGFFRTPESLASELVMRADVRRGMTVLEPSAGDGRIVAPLLSVGATVYAIERDPARRAALRRLPYGPWGSLHVQDADDFMSWGMPPLPPLMLFDRVVMNPPFCKVGLGDHLDHVRRAFGMLAPGGILVSVLPSGVTFREDTRHREFRTWCLNRGTLTDLEPNSFKSSGTSVNTCVARLEAPP